VKGKRIWRLASASTMPRIFFWFGQTTNQTLAVMIMASHMPMPIVTTCLCQW
jgi:hypothetical protein